MTFGGLRLSLRDFPAFGWGLSLRLGFTEPAVRGVRFPRLRAGIFAVVLNVNREISRGLRSPVLETKLVFRMGLFSLKHEDGLDAVPTADSSCQLSEPEMTKSDARNL